MIAVQHMRSRHSFHSSRIVFRAACGLIAVGLLLVTAPAVQAAVTWDGGDESPWWFAPDNWNDDAAMTVPPLKATELGGTAAAGDYNEDGVNDAADYTVWRDAKEAGSMTLPNRDPGKNDGVDPVDEGDYTYWRDNFGAVETIAFDYYVDDTSDATINGTMTGVSSVIYDPSSTDPNWDTTSNASYWDNGPPNPLDPITFFGPQKIWRLYLGRAPGVDDGEDPPTMPLLNSTLTIRGDITSPENPVGDARWQLGRNSGLADVPVTGTIIHEGGVITNNFGDIDLGSSDTNLPEAFGNGTWDYRGGSLEQGLGHGTGDGTTRFRLSGGGSSSAGGIGTFIMHNPGDEAGGHVRVRELLSASFGGQGVNNPDGVERGVAIFEFHLENGGTRPFQIKDNMLLANGQNCQVTGCAQPSAYRSSRLRLVLDEAPALDGGVPENLGLFDIDSDNDGFGFLGFPDDDENGLGITFSDADAVDPLDPSAVYDNLLDGTDLTAVADNIVTADFGGDTYRWRIFYNGNIVWSDQDNSIVSDVEAPGDCTATFSCTDIVLVGLDVIPGGAGAIAGVVPEPSSALLALLAGFGLVFLRRRS